ncbi:MAG: 2Fe-2S iron-sulfur cluster-binding protein [Verrucomicrobia bacterium]|nr:2Fe-2S iron-sulfur cluster-binding protein [Verrucomicrobiota bacterium]
MPEMVNFTLDGREVSVPRGSNVIDAAKQCGVEVPHYCYHQRLTVAGNCRMCLVEIGMPKLGPDRKPEVGPDGKPVIAFAPKLVIGCNQAVSEGMVVNTVTPRVRKAREGVMEFLLINHPLDCPICDQAGECRLQEFAVDYGRAASRFVEIKEHKPKRVPLGPKITLDNERCIACSRCVRFMKEVAKQDCLGFVERGGRSVLTAFPGHEPNTNYDLNIVDICPVGALTSNDFRFRQRVWFLKETRSICPHCATGCNTLVSSRENVVYRQQPRDNADVNQSWMCDQGRLNYRFVNDSARLTTATVRAANATDATPVAWSEAVAAMASALRNAQHAGQGTAIIGSARATTEELFLLRRLGKDVLRTDRMETVSRAGKADGFLVSADRNPNTLGAYITGVGHGLPESTIPEICAAIARGEVRALLVFGENIAKHGIPEAILAKLDFLGVIDVLPNAVTKLAHVVIPGMTFIEKQGTFINGKGRMQRLKPGVRLAGDIHPEWRTLGTLLQALGAGEYADFDAVFQDMVRTLPPLQGVTYASIGDQGLDLKLAERPGEEAVAWNLP